MMNYLVLIVSVGLAVVGQLLMKRGMQLFGTFPISQLPVKFLPMVFSPFVFFGIASFALSAVFWLVVLSRFDLSMAYPMVSLGYVVVAIVSVFWLGETVSLVRWLGIAVICLGVFLISRT